MQILQNILTFTFFEKGSIHSIKPCCMKKIVSITNLKFNYHQKPPVFNNANTELEFGKVYALLGPKGAGKSTLLKLLCGVVFPTSGMIDVLGFDPKQRRYEMIKDIYYIPHSNFKTTLSLKKFIDLYSPFYHRFSTVKLQNILSDFLINTKINDLSLLEDSQIWKIKIAFALATNCKLILMDEPAIDFDESTKTIFNKIISENWSKDNCIIIATSEPKKLGSAITDILVLSDKTIFINKSIEQAKNELLSNKDILSDLTELDLIYNAIAETHELHKTE